MFSILKNRFGIPGVISVIAFVFAMFGGAYAATNGGSGKATASAKAKKGPRGPKGPKGPKGDPGPTGPAGSQGQPGADGKNGANGTNGKDGTNGVTVTSTESGGTIDGTHCVGAGGSKFVSAGGTTYACNGKQGDPGPLLEALPGGKTLTGAWGDFASATDTPSMTTISFPFPLAAALEATDVVFLKQGEGETTDCPGTAAEPEAASGKLCVFTMNEAVSEGTPFKGGTFTSAQGVSLLFLSFKGILQGTWAVKAP